MLRWKKIREIVTIGLQKRAEAKIKVRQPLADLRFKNNDLREEFINIIAEEVNVKNVIKDENIADVVVLNTEITEDLKLEGQAREVIRFIQEMRKEAGYQVDNRIKIGYSRQSSVFDKFGKLIAKETLADKLESKLISEADLEKEVQIEGEKIIISIRR